MHSNFFLMYSNVIFWFWLHRFLIFSSLDPWYCVRNIHIFISETSDCLYEVIKDYVKVLLIYIVYVLLRKTCTHTHTTSANHQSSNWLEMHQLWRLSGFFSVDVLAGCSPVTVFIFTVASLDIPERLEKREGVSVAAVLITPLSGLAISLKKKRRKVLTY